MARGIPRMRELEKGDDERGKFEGKQGRRQRSVKER